MMISKYIVLNLLNYRELFEFNVNLNFYIDNKVF